jgi:hypothetical protein
VFSIWSAAQQIVDRAPVKEVLDRARRVVIAVQVNVTSENEGLKLSALQVIEFRDDAVQLFFIRYSSGKIS